jgi:hypothetical protein
VRDEVPAMGTNFLQGEPRLRIWLGVFTFAGVGLLTATLRGDDSPRPPVGEIRLASGRVAQYTIHFDRNSLRDSIRSGHGLIALSTSGTLLRFELPAVRLTRERIASEELTCIGRGEGETVLAGLSDGRICRVDPLMLDLAEVAKLPAAAHWVGWASATGNRAAGLLAATRQAKPVERDGHRWQEPFTIVHDLATGKTMAAETVVSAFLLDRAGRLWLGADNGEWGGRVSWVDLSKGRSRKSSRRRPASPMSRPAGREFMASLSSATVRSGPTAAPRTWE